MAEHRQLFVDGRWDDAQDGATFESVDPATGEVLATLAAAGALVPIGSFNEGQKVTLWAGVSPRDFPTLTITQEQADGDQASSGQRVLVGQINDR